MENETTMTTIKMIIQDLVSLDRFEGTNFIRWKDKLKFLCTTLKIFNILGPDPILLEPTPNDIDAVRATKKKRQEDKLICR